MTINPTAFGTAKAAILRVPLEQLAANARFAVDTADIDLDEVVLTDVNTQDAFAEAMDAIDALEANIKRELSVEADVWNEDAYKAAKVAA